MKLFNAIFATVTAGLLAATLALTAATFVGGHADGAASQSQVAMVEHVNGNG